MTTGCFVAWPLTGGAERVHETVRDELADVNGPDDADSNAGGTGVSALLSGVDAATVSVFVYDADGDDPRLVWYVEHESGDRWRDHARVVREHSPLWPALEPLVGDGDPAVVADGERDATELVHAFLPDRPTAWASSDDDLPVCLPRDEDGASEPHVVPLVLSVRPGLGSLFARGFAGLLARTPARLEAKFEAASLDVMEAEGMCTETLLLERTGRGYDLWWYMESGGMDQVYEAYYDSDSHTARVSEHVLGWALERPERVLANPVEASEFELLAHAVDRDRD